MRKEYMGVASHSARVRQRGKERRNAIIQCDSFFQVDVDERREESVLGGQKWVKVLWTAAQLNEYGRIAVSMVDSRWEEAARKEWFDIEPGTRTTMRFCILYEQMSTNGSIVGD